jgi:hypothetical protein
MPLEIADDYHPHGLVPQPDRHPRRFEGGVLSCTKTSDKDVYSHSIWATESNIRQFTMHEGDSIVIPPGSTVTIWIFRRQPGNSTWTMDFELKEKAA